MNPSAFLTIKKIYKFGVGVSVAFGATGGLVMTEAGDCWAKMLDISYNPSYLSNCALGGSVGLCFGLVWPVALPYILISEVIDRNNE
jgi:hypothetical protein